MKNLKRIGNIITILAIIFLVQKLLRLELDLEAFYSKEGILVLFLTIFVYGWSAFLAFQPWRRLISIWEPKKISWKKVSYIYVKSNLLKYIPGNIFQYVGRNQLALENDLSHVNLFAASFLEIVCIILSAVLFSVLICGKNTVNLIQQFGWKIIPLFLILLLVLGGVVLILQKKYRQKFQEHILSRLAPFKLLRTWRIVSLTVAFYLLLFSLQSVMFYAILNICASNRISIGSLHIVMGAYVLSWLIGYITPGSPGGLGVREIVLLGLLSQSALSEDSITFSLVVMRAANIVGDVLAYIAAASINYMGINHEGEAR